MELISSDAQEVEHRMMEIEQALNSSRTTDAEKQELELKYTDTKKMIAKIHADREAHEVKSLTFKLERGADARTFDGTARLARVKTERVSEAIANEVLTRAASRWEIRSPKTPLAAFARSLPAWTSTSRCRSAQMAPAGSSWCSSPADRLPIIAATGA